MKIGQKQDAASVDAALRAGSRSASASSTAGSNASSNDTDSVKLSGASQALGSTDLPVRAEKVAAIRKAIEEGKYQMDIEAIADNMIADAARLIQTIGLPPGRAS